MNSPYPSVGLRRVAPSQQRKGMKRARSVSRRAHSCGPGADESGHPIGSRCVPCATTKRSQTRRRCSVARGGRHGFVVTISLAAPNSNPPGAAFVAVGFGRWPLFYSEVGS